MGPVTERAVAAGLSATEVAERVRQGQVNRTDSGPGRTTGEIIRSNVFTLFNLIMGALFVVMLAIGDFNDALFGFVAIANTAIGIVQELRAKRSLERLALVGRPRVHVRRGGAAEEIDSDDVVLDDVILVSLGDKAVVDGEVLEAEALELDESLLTGEADPVVKHTGDRILSGSFAVAGSGAFRATAVGGDAYAAQLVEQASRFQLTHSQLRDDINHFLRLITWAIVPLSVLLAISQSTNGESWRDAVTGTVAGVVTMIPEGLVLLTSVALAVGVVRLGRRQCLVQELAAIEGLARVDVVCADKTGTLTEDRMQVVETVTLGPVPEATIGEALGALAAADDHPNASMRAIQQTYATDPGWHRTGTAAFSSARKWSGTSFGPHGNWVLGAPEMLLAPGDPALSDAAIRADKGLRVLLLARAAQPVDAPGGLGSVEAVALVVIEQAVRPDAAETLRYFASQGVQVKVISGDDARTVGAIAANLGLPGADEPVDARTLPTEPEALADAMQAATVFGRVTPQQKRAMVHALQSRGHTVAMTGDGVNDVLALKDADIGIAMGSGADATRSVAQIVLLDDRFATLPSVVGEGRKVIGNIERVAKLFLTKTAYATVMALSVGVARLPFPFLPRHLTLVTSLTIAVPAFVLALAPNTDRVGSGMVGRVLRFAVPCGAVAAACTFGVYYIAENYRPTTLDQDRTTATVVLFVVGLGVLTAVARPLAAWKVALVAAMVGAFALSLWVPFLTDFFALDLAEAADLTAAIAVGVVGFVVVNVIGQFTIVARGEPEAASP